METAALRRFRLQDELDRVSCRSWTGAAAAETGRFCMQDVLMLLYTVIFFAVAFLYVKACQKLR